MKIIVLGSSADKGFFQRKGKDRRSRSSIAFENKGRTIVIDAGPDFWRQIKRERIKPKAIFLTHSHPDHIKGLYLKKIDTPVYASKRTWKDLKRCQVSGNRRQVFENKKTVEIFGLEVTPFKVYHTSTTETYGFKIDGFVYVPEIRKLTPLAKKYMDKPKVLVLDGAILDRDLNVHASIKRQLKWLEGLHPKKVYFTNIGRNTARKSHQELVKYLHKKDKRVGVFYDGFRFEI